MSNPTVSRSTVARAHRMSLRLQEPSTHMGVRKANKTSVMWPVLEFVAPLCSITFGAHFVLTDGTDDWLCGKNKTVESDWSGFSLFSRHWTILINHCRVNGYTAVAWTTAMPTDSHANTFSKWEKHMQLCSSAWKLGRNSFQISHWNLLQLMKLVTLYNTLSFVK